MMNKKIVIKSVSIVIVILLLSRVNALAEIVGHFEDNIKILNKMMSVEDSKEFISKDKIYLENKPEVSKVIDEQKQLESKLQEIESEYELVKGIKVYKGNTGLKNNAVRTAIKNREKYIKNIESFKYDDSTIYNIDRDFIAESGTNRYLTQQEMDLNYEAVVEIIENIELNLQFLNNTIFIISPFILEGMKGYTVSRSNRKSTIVISNRVFGAPRSWIKMSTKSTVLHEIGHVFQNSNEEKFKNNGVASKYLVEADKELKVNNIESSSENKNWKSSINENFAEDFRIYFSTKLGSKSFEPLAKKTVAEYDELNFTELIANIIK